MKLNKNEILIDTLWIAFGLISGISYYRKSEFLICFIMFSISILYSYKLFKNFKKDEKN
ncbi:hypothetical protein [Flavobacterium sp.]|uniref:hypothetical protein n=1 Tax=Flavobacterium sp. TaxID=239 RepID=UPI0040488B2B